MVGVTSSVPSKDELLQVNSKKASIREQLASLLDHVTFSNCGRYNP